MRIALSVAIVVLFCLCGCSVEPPPQEEDLLQAGGSADPRAVATYNRYLEAMRRGDHRRATALALIPRRDLKPLVQASISSKFAAYQFWIAIFQHIDPEMKYLLSMLAQTHLVPAGQDYIVARVADGEGDLHVVMLKSMMDPGNRSKYESMALTINSIVLTSAGYRVNVIQEFEDRLGIIDLPSNADHPYLIALAKKAKRLRRLAPIFDTMARRIRRAEFASFDEVQAALRTELSNAKLSMER